MLPSEGVVEKAIELITRYSWQEAGQSRSEAYKVITVKSYPLAGGIVNLGGRPRFRNGEWMVTVGKQTTYFYKPDRGKDMAYWDSARFRTKDLLGIEGYLRGFKV